MLFQKIRNACLWFLLMGFTQVNGQTPICSYLDNFSFKDTGAMKLIGPARTVTLKGRRGLNMTSIRSVLELKAHNMGNRKGTVSLWVMPLEELSSFDTKPNFGKSNPDFYFYPFLSDCADPADLVHANFKLAWTPRWHPSLVAQFGKGTFYEEAFNIPHKAVVSVSHFAFSKNTWYQLTLSWDYDKDAYALYVNGIQVGREDQYHEMPLYRDSINHSLFLGSPALCFSGIHFYAEVFSPAQAASHYKKEAIYEDTALNRELAYTYAGGGRKRFAWTPGKGWKQKLSISLTHPADIDSFYVQGNPVKAAVTKEGLLVETVNKEYTGSLLDSQVYVWSNRPFEGNLYVEYEFKVLRPGGLSLLMVQASGMNREDFMADYPLRTSGRMTTVYGEDVRNYHWEYYREMADMRNDLANSALMKNPFLYPLSFGSLSKPVEKNVWHKLQFLQEGRRLRGAIDGIIMVDFTDDGSSNNGPVYDFGRIAIRCMLRTKMLFRNLKVYNEEKFASKPVEGQEAGDNMLSKEERAQGWTLLFDGKTSNGWMKSDGSAFPAKGWEIKDGILTIKEDQKAGDIVTTGEYGDFELKADFRIGPACNSGIKYFYTDYPTGGGLGMEYQVMDDKGASDNKLANHLCGSLYDIFPPDETVKKMNPLGEWNHLRIVSKDKHVEHWLNGVKILEFERGSRQYLDAVAKSKYKTRPVFGMVEKGMILLQDHGHEASFRNIKIRRL